MIKFSWDPTKARSNLKKHGVSFEEAQSVFYDEFALQFCDYESSEEELRIISARKATSSERQYYEGDPS